MNSDLLEFIKILETENRLEALRYILEVKTRQNLSVLKVYEDFLTPALNEMVPTANENIDIWREHVRTSIIRTIVENMLPFVQEERTKAGSIGKTAAVLCPPEEYHDVGARMASDILNTQGFDTIFVGSNTPYRVFEAGLAASSIDYIAISISNPYHLVSARKIIQGIRSSHPGVKIIVGGNAILKHPDIAEVLGADFTASSLEDLSRLKGGIDHAAI